MSKPRESKTSRRRIEATERQRQALELRKAGATYDDIAARVGYSGRTAAYHGIMSALAKMLQEPAEELRTLEVERLDSLLLSVWPRALGGDLKAVETTLRIMERRARLIGLDLQPALTAEQPGAQINALVLQIVRDPELAEIADQLAARLHGAGGHPVEPAPTGSAPLAGLLASRTPS
jgi:hypothetical protein